MTDEPGTFSYTQHSTVQRRTFRAPYLVRLWIADKMEIPSARVSLAEVCCVTVGRGDACGHTRSHDGKEARLHILVADGWMSAQHFELHEEDGQWVVQDRGSKNGIVLNRSRCSRAILLDGDLIHAGNTTFLFRSEVLQNHLESGDMNASEFGHAHFVEKTLSLPLARTMADLTRVSTSDLSIILGGETGTGKEVGARAIHRGSKRLGQFVAVNCGAIPANLVESELFGHRKGVFSGATTDRVGLVQASDGGTLFLDEVAELSPEAQVSLLRVLQEREVVPVGATRPVPVNLRVVSATHVDLEGLVEAGEFRADLYSRLAGVCFRLPRLWERREDLGVLIASLLYRISASRSFVFEREALWAMALYSWPRNIRELEQALGAAVAWTDAGEIGRRHLPPEVSAALESASVISTDRELIGRLKSSLRRHQGNVSAAAREMGKARVQIRRWCKRFGIDPGDYR